MKEDLLAYIEELDSQSYQLSGQVYEVLDKIKKRIENYKESPSVLEINVADEIKADGGLV